MFDLKPLRTLAAAGLLALMAGGASAATCNIANFTTSTACVSPVTGGPGGNVIASEMNRQSIFGRNNWTLLAELEEPDTESGSETFGRFGSLVVFTVTYGPDGAQSGTWALNPLLRWGAGLFAFAIKGATSNAVYLMDTRFRFGTWNVVDLLNAGGNPDMSNIRLFGTAQLAPIPLPAAGFLMLGALGLLSRRRRKAA